MRQRRSCGLLACLALGACTIGGHDIVLCTSLGAPGLASFNLLTDTVYVGTADDTLAISLVLDHWSIDPVMDSSLHLRATPPDGGHVHELEGVLVRYGPAEAFGFPIRSGTLPGRWRIAGLTAWFLATDCPAGSDQEDYGAPHLFNASAIAGIGGDTLFEVVK